MKATTRTVQIDTSPNATTAADRALAVLRDWWRRLLDDHPAPPISRSHDAGTGLTPLATLIRLSSGMEHDAAVAYLRAFRDASIDFYEREGLMRGGYWREQEAHHGPEYYQIFLYTLGMLDPDDDRNVNAFRRAADFVAMPTSARPRWIDRETGMFRSLFLGSERVGEPTVNAPDHLRFADLCLKCYRLTGLDAYRDAGLRYLRRWAIPIATAPTIPAALSQQGEPLSHESLANDDYLSFVGQLLPTAPELSAAENLVASGAVGLFLAAWSETGDERFVAACERLIDAVLPALAEPAAWQVPAQIRRYRLATGRARYDGALGAIPESSIRAIETLAISDERPRFANRFVGDRTDKPDWRDEHRSEAPNPVLIGLAAEAAGDDGLWARALDQSTAYLRLALEVYGAYRDHGCTAKAFHAVARGHGRLDASGVVTEVLNRYLEVPNPEVV